MQHTWRVQHGVLYKERTIFRIVVIRRSLLNSIEMSFDLQLDFIRDPGTDIGSPHKLFYFRPREERAPRFELNMNYVKWFLMSKYGMYFATYLRILHALMDCWEMTSKTDHRFLGQGTYVTAMISAVDDTKHCGSLVFYANLAHTGPQFPRDRNNPIEYTISYFMRPGDMWVWDPNEYLDNAMDMLFADRMDQTSIRRTIANGVAEVYDCTSVYKVAQIIFQDIFPFLERTNSLECAKEFYNSQLPQDTYQKTIEFFHFKPIKCTCYMCTRPLQRGFLKKAPSCISDQGKHILRVMFLEMLARFQYIESDMNSMFAINFFANTRFTPWLNIFPRENDQRRDQGTQFPSLFGKYYFTGADFPYFYVQMYLMDKKAITLLEVNTAKRENPRGPDFYNAAHDRHGDHHAILYAATVSDFEHWMYGVPSRHATNSLFRLRDEKCPVITMVWSQIDLELNTSVVKNEEYFFKRTLIANQDFNHFTALDTEAVTVELITIAERMQYYCGTFRSVNMIMGGKIDNFDGLEKLVLQDEDHVPQKRPSVSFCAPMVRKRFKEEFCYPDTYPTFHSIFNNNIEDDVQVDRLRFGGISFHLPVQDMNFVQQRGITRPVYTLTMNNNGMMVPVPENRGGEANVNYFMYSDTDMIKEEDTDMTKEM